jgi:starch phosphorylase
LLVLVDCAACVECQNQVSALSREREAWTRKSIVNGAGVGQFASDRSMRDYCDQM